MTTESRQGELTGAVSHRRTEMPGWWVTVAAIMLALFAGALLFTGREAQAAPQGEVPGTELLSAAGSEGPASPTLASESASEPQPAESPEADQTAGVREAAPEGTLQQAAGPVAEPVSRTAKPVVSPVRRTVEPAAEPVRQAVEPVQQTTEPAIGQLRESAEPVRGAVEPVGQAVEPVVEPVRKLAEPVRETAKPVVEPVRETLEPVVEPVREIVEPGGKTEEPGAPAPTPPGHGLVAREPVAGSGTVHGTVARESAPREPRSGAVGLGREDEKPPQPPAEARQIPRTAASAAAAPKESAPGAPDHTFAASEAPAGSSSHPAAGAEITSRVGAEPAAQYARTFDYGVAGERAATVPGSSETRGGPARTPGPAPAGIMPAAEGLTGASGPGGGGIGPGALALVCILVLVCRLLWTRREFSRPVSALRLAIESPG